MAVPPPTPGPIAADPAKAPLREELRARRHDHAAALGPAAAHAAADAAAALLLPHIPAGAVVALSLAFKDELDPDPLLRTLHAAGQPLALPYLADDTTMNFRAWQPGDPLARGPFRLRQPLAAAPPRAPDLIILPLLGFDRAGGRIGQGASHYDRAFARFPGARRVGFAWSVQEVSAVPHDPWDVALHAIVTEREWIVAE
jgi:5-formyltetrahydrofolate cyclo-ligase